MTLHLVFDMSQNEAFDGDSQGNPIKFQHRIFKNNQVLGGPFILMSTVAGCSLSLLTPQTAHSEIKHCEEHQLHCHWDSSHPEHSMIDVSSELLTCYHLFL